MNNTVIATLPENDMENMAEYNDEEKILKTVNYSDKSFIVFGEATRIHKNTLKSLGGRFNGRLKERPGFSGGPAWIFPSSLKDKVFPFINEVNDKKIDTHFNVPAEGDQSSLPTVNEPIRHRRFQYVKWKVFLPKNGMNVTVKANGVEHKGTVLQTDMNKNFVDTVYISIDGKTSKLVICNGKWQVWGYMVEHVVYFSENKEENKEEKRDGNGEMQVIE